MNLREIADELSTQDVVEVKHKIIYDHRHAITKLTEPIMKELTDKDVKDKEILDDLYHKLVVIVTLLSGLGNPTQRAVLSSATVALSSVFPINEFPRFLALGKFDKERQIEEMAHVVSGIRIFNYHYHRQEDGIDDLPTILKEACAASLEVLKNEKTSVNKSIDLLCKFLSDCYVETPNPKDPELIDIVLRIPPKASKEIIEFFKDLLIAKRQMDDFIGKLNSEVKKCEQEVSSNVEMLTGRLNDLKDLVRYRTAIPTTYIYPIFMHVSAIWCCLQDQVILLSAYNKILQTLKEFIHAFNQRTHLLESLLDDKIKRDAKAAEEVQKLEQKSPCTAINPSKIQNCRVFSMQDRSQKFSSYVFAEPKFGGCCTLKLIVGNGLLLPSNPKIGMLTFGMVHYGFSSCEAAYTFDRNPEMYLNQLITMVRGKPELVVLLDMADAIERYAFMSELSPQMSKLTSKLNAETQTLLHPVESYIDPNYSWDVWELKRKAVQLANICKRKTHSTQTNKSHMRNTFGTQTYTLKDNSTQTKEDNKTIMPKLSNFIFGLRGRLDNVAHTAILTRPNDEWLYEQGARILN
ncbi:cilia- and flagella-associated protein 206 [Lycorma delicatula]|uniref:cilia- and flagella-associated protein 206 n=1 Tax=Lycorma delicatula TaxID=130591 RepID=UPI003F5140C5